MHAPLLPTPPKILLYDESTKAPHFREEEVAILLDEPVESPAGSNLVGTRKVEAVIEKAEEGDEEQHGVEVAAVVSGERGAQGRRRKILRKSHSQRKKRRLEKVLSKAGLNPTSRRRAWSL
jgi:hypothetical protein